MTSNSSNMRSTSARGRLVKSRPMEPRMRCDSSASPALYSVAASCPSATRSTLLEPMTNLRGTAAGHGRRRHQHQGQAGVAGRAKGVCARTPAGAAAWLCGSCSAQTAADCRRLIARLPSPTSGRRRSGRLGSSRSPGGVDRWRRPLTDARSWAKLTCWCHGARPAAP